MWLPCLLSGSCGPRSAREHLLSCWARWLHHPVLVKTSPPALPPSLSRGFLQPICFFFPVLETLPLRHVTADIHQVTILVQDFSAGKGLHHAIHAGWLTRKNVPAPGGKLVWTTTCWEALALSRCPKSARPLLAVTLPQPCQQRHLAETFLTGLASSLAPTHPKWHKLNKQNCSLKAQLYPDQGFCWHC